MATFTTTWNTAYEALPPDTGEAASLGASRIRNFKETARERIEIDHYLDGDAHDGKHKKVTLKAQGSNPTLETGDSALFSKDVSGTTELFWKDSDATVVQVTGAGAISAFPSGTRMLFQQTSAPTGWTKDTTDVNNMALRVVSGTVGSGGTDSFSTVFGSSVNTGSTAPGTNTQGAHSHGGNTAAGGNHNHGGSALSGGAHTHTALSAGGHTHITPNSGFGDDNIHPSPGIAKLSGLLLVGSGETETDETLESVAGATLNPSTNTSGAHTHTTDSSSTHTHVINNSGTHVHTISSDGGHSHTVNSHVHSMTMDLAYLDVIIAVKD